MQANKANARKVSAALTPHVNAVLMATAYAKTIREKFDVVYGEILDIQDVRDDKGERITDPRYYWTMAERYEAAYFAECDKRRAELGHVLPPGNCPALIAECLQRDAEHLLIEASAEFFPGVTVNSLLCCADGLGRLREYIDLLIKLVVNSPGYRKPAMP